MKRILITGGTGFIGSNLASRLVRDGYHVRILRRTDSDLRAVRDIDVEHVIGDVRDPDSLRKAFQGCDTVFHTAAIVSHWTRRRPALIETNVTGTRHVVSACLETGVEKMVHTSSIAAIGFPGNGRLADESNVFNWEPYDIGYRNAKHQAELEVRNGLKRGLQAVIVNPSVVIGPGDFKFNSGQIIRDVFKKRIFYYVRGGMSIVYVDDVIAGHIAAATKGRVGERYILSGENLTHQQTFSIIAEVVGGWKPILKLPMPVARVISGASEIIGNALNVEPWVSRELASVIDLTCWYSAEKARRELGYTITPFREAVRRTFTWYREFGYL
jgi:dihydroflavonol-4-reductase